MVTVPVPLSTSYPNAALLCDVLTANATTIICRTRAHMPTNAGDAQPAVPAPSPASAVTLAHCSDKPESDTGKMACWARGVAQRRSAKCTGVCSFAYSAEDTPRVQGVDADMVDGLAVVKGGDHLTVNGTGTTELGLDSRPPTCSCFAPLSITSMGRNVCQFATGAAAYDVVSGCCTRRQPAVGMLC